MSAIVNTMSIDDLADQGARASAAVVLIQFAWNSPGHGRYELPLYMLIFPWKYKSVFKMYAILPHWHDTGRWNPYSCRTRNYILYIVNIMSANVLATQGARASGTMILTMLNRNNSAPHTLRVRRHNLDLNHRDSPSGSCLIRSPLTAMS